MKTLKKPLTYQEQVDKLKAHGMIIDDDQKAENILRTSNYYRFTGYALQFRVTPMQSDYIPGTHFDSIHQIYLFDEALRDICRRYIEIAEVYYRTQIAYGFSIVKCIAPPHDQHYDIQNFYNKNGYKEVMTNFRKEKNYYKDSLIVKHHKLKYSSKLPLWAMVELMSFSNLSKLYSSMYLSEKESIAASVGTGHRILENHLHCLSVLRNKCAHAARLYNTKLAPPVKFSKSFLQSHPEVRNDSMFAYLLMLLRRLPNTSVRLSFVTEIFAVIEQYQEHIELPLIGFPDNYANLLENSCK